MFTCKSWILQRIVPPDKAFPLLPRQWHKFCTWKASYHSAWESLIGHVGYFWNFFHICTIGTWRDILRSIRSFGNLKIPGHLILKCCNYVGRLKLICEGKLSMIGKGIYPCHMTRGTKTWGYIFNIFDTLCIPFAGLFCIYYNYLIKLTKLSY